MNTQLLCRPPSEHAFDAVAALYDSWFAVPLGRTVDELEKDLLYRLAQLHSGERALDVGTGTGHFAVDLAHRGLVVVGVDLSSPMLAVAKSKGSAVHLLRGDAAALPLAAESFDLVLSVTALEFVACPERAVQEMWRAVRPGGRLVVGVLNALSPWAWVRRRESKKQETPFSHAHFFYPWEFVRLLRRLGAVTWSSSVFISPHGAGLRWAWGLERVGRTAFRPFGALLVGRVTKWPSAHR
ncbi:MAG: class I SAM-dependent methyltransferase [Chloroflexi bacterium]|nr:class I SAM-dependent methyltransferase [Chloroflexota bacterium]